MNQKFFYSVDGKQTEDLFELELNWFGDMVLTDREIEWLAEKLADDFFSNHDGWEAQWPRDVHIWDSEMKYIGCVNVMLESEPVFYGYLVKEE
jgi:hypothetical protein